jgi:hypothetical protein
LLGTESQGHGRSLGDESSIQLLVRFPSCRHGVLPIG